MIEPRPEVAAAIEAHKYKRLMVLCQYVPRTPGYCAWCGKEHGKRRKYCGQACQGEAHIRASGQSIISQVFWRDRGVCAACGFDAHSVRDELRRIVKSYWHAYYGVYDMRPIRAGWKKQWGPWWSPHGRYWEADHIVPVSEGGGCCGLENYQTLCLRCHRLCTKQLAARRAEKARADKAAAIGQQLMTFLA